MTDTKPLLHLPGAGSGSLVNTPYLLGAQGAVLQMAELNGIVEVEGPSGSGKTFSVRAATNLLHVPVYEIATSDRPHGKQTISTIYEAISGVEPNTRIPSHKLQREV